MSHLDTRPLEQDQRWESEGFNFQLTQRWPHKGGWRVARVHEGHLDYHDAHFVRDEEIRRCRYIGMAPPDERSPRARPRPLPNPPENIQPDSTESSTGGRWVTVVLVVLAIAGGVWLLVHRAPDQDQERIINGRRYHCTPVESE